MGIYSKALNQPQINNSHLVQLLVLAKEQLAIVHLVWTTRLGGMYYMYIPVLQTMRDNVLQSKLTVDFFHSCLSNQGQVIPT